LKQAWTASTGTNTHQSKARRKELLRSNVGAFVMGVSICREALVAARADPTDRGAAAVKAARGGVAASR